MGINQFFKKENMFFWYSVLLLLVVDQFSKNIANFILVYEQQYLFNTNFSLQVVLNEMIFMGEHVDPLGLNSVLAYRIMYISIGLLLLAGLFKTITFPQFYEKKLSVGIMKMSVACLSAGILGNVLDRIFYSGVIDFIRFDNADYTIIFNAADVFIFVGAIMSILAIKFELFDFAKQKIRIG